MLRDMEKELAEAQERNNQDVDHADKELADAKKTLETAKADSLPEEQVP